MTTSFQAPPLWMLASEPRAVAELGAFAAATPVLRALPPGDGHPVLVLPGFTASDQSTAPLRWYLRQQGYSTHGWKLGRNVGPTKRIMEGMRSRLDDLYERSGRTVSLVGWSLGGCYARELARETPETVRQVITLGSPFRLRMGDRTHANALFEHLARDFVEPPEDMLLPEHERAPLGVPCTAIYSRTDGVARWHGCIEAERDSCENIEVLGSHSGLGFNPAAIYAIADRLNQPEGHWKPFKAPGYLRGLFPKPVWWEDRSRRAAAAA